MNELARCSARGVRITAGCDCCAASYDCWRRPRGVLSSRNARVTDYEVCANYSDHA